MCLNRGGLGLGFVGITELIERHRCGLKLVCFEMVIFSFCYVRVDEVD